MIELILAIQLICSVATKDTLYCEMQVHQCYRELKNKNVTDDMALKVCVKERIK